MTVIDRPHFSSTEKHKILLDIERESPSKLLEFKVNLISSVIPSGASYRFSGSDKLTSIASGGDLHPASAPLELGISGEWHKKMPFRTAPDPFQSPRERELDNLRYELGIIGHEIY